MDVSFSQEANGRTPGDVPRRAKARNMSRVEETVGACHAFLLYNSSCTLTEPLLNRASEEKRHHVADRRRHTVRALIHGGLRPRRLGPRRADDASIAAVDWHDARWLA